MPHAHNPNLVIIN